MHRELRLLFEIQMIRLLGKLRKLFKVKEGKLFYIGGSDVLPPPLDKDEEQRILEEYMEGSLEARQP